MGSQLNLGQSKRKGGAMEPPRWVCERLAEIHPWVRLGWIKNGNLCNEDAESGGEFAVVQLMHIRDSGPKWRPRTIREFWDVHTVQIGPEQFVMERIERGTLYNRRGGVSPDWDPLTRQPVIIAGVDKQFGLSVHSVFDGRIISWLRAQAKPAREILKERVHGARAAGVRLEDKVKNLTGLMSEELNYMANQTGEASVDVPKKFIESTRRLDAQRAGELDFSDEYVNKIPKAMIRESQRT